MILADTSIWIDHLRHGDAKLQGLLEEGKIVMHPLVRAEIALGSLKNRQNVLSLLDGLPHIGEASTAEVNLLIEERMLFSRGIGYVDAALLASCLLEPGTSLWTRDRALNSVAFW